MTVTDAIRRRRLIHARRERDAANARLRGVGRDLRRMAQAELNAGHPERAQPYLDEAVVFEGAVRGVPAL
jgi:hypothetical protein